MSALDEAGLRVPDDVAIVGSGNIHYGDMLRVPLTTVSWSKMDMGESSAHLLIAMIESEEKKQKVRQIEVVQPELIVRQSCGAVKLVAA
jgi:DNA-binding LacI/PurR family transcriptional regulator